MFNISKALEFCKIIFFTLSIRSDYHFILARLFYVVIPLFYGNAPTTFFYLCPHNSTLFNIIKTVQMITPYEIFPIMIYVMFLFLYSKVN